MNYPALWSNDVERRIRKKASNLDEQVSPKDVRFCRVCIISNQRPRIVFDADGVCSACRYAERKRSGIDWNKRENELRRVLDGVRDDGPYNVVVPCSGGKDSAFVAHTLKHKYGMRPLCATWAPLIYTDIGRRNFDSFVHSGFDVVTATPNGLMNRKMARLALEFYGDPFLPFIYGQLAWPMHVALRFGIRLIFAGENGEATYGGDTSANDLPSWDAAEWERIYMKGAGVRKLLGISVASEACSKEEGASQTSFHSLPSFDARQQAGLQFHWLGYYLPWHPQANFYHAAEHTGFEPNEARSEGTYSRYASLDDKLDGLHYWFGYLKFGLGRCTSDAAHEIRDGELTREEAAALVKRYDGERPTRHLAECLDYLGIDDAHLQMIENRFRASHLWNGQTLKHAVYDQVPSDRAA